MCEKNNLYDKIMSSDCFSCPEMDIFTNKKQKDFPVRLQTGPGSSSHMKKLQEKSFMLS